MARDHRVARDRRVRYSTASPVASVIAELVGVTTADIKDFGAYYHKDVYWIETWNRRILNVDGMEVFNALSHRWG